MDGEVLGMVGASGEDIMPFESAATKAGADLAKKSESKFKRNEFSWRKIYHALQSPIYTKPEVGAFFMEVVFTSTSMRLYTDHRVMGAIVLPGVSHVSLFAATGSVGFPSPGGLANDWHMSVKEVLFERPYIVNSGAELIAAISAGADPSQIGGGGGGMQAAMLPV